MKLEAITVPTPAPRSDLENLIIGMNKARKGESSPQENTYTLRIAEKMQREAFTRGDTLFTSEFTELFNFVCEEQHAPLEETVIDGEFEIVEGKPQQKRGPKEYLKLTVETAASYRFLTDLQARIEERGTFFPVDVLKTANHYGITRQAIRQYLRDYANKGLIGLKITNEHKPSVIYSVGPTLAAPTIDFTQEQPKTNTERLIRYLKEMASEVAIYIDPVKLGALLDIKSQSLVALLNIFKNKNYITCKSVGEGIRLVRFVDAPASYFK